MLLYIILYFSALPQENMYLLQVEHRAESPQPQQQLETQGQWHRQ